MKTKPILSIVLFVVLGLITTNVFAQIPAPPQTQPIALTNAVIHPVDIPTIPNGTLIFDNGKIIALGANITIPNNALTINLNGKHVYPGMIETASQLGLTEIGSVPATNDASEMDTINAALRAEVAVNPESAHFPVARANGIALAITSPSGGVIAGQSALLNLDGWTWEEMTYKAPISLVINWPTPR
ncbi:MAG: hypothetical protein GY869_30660, partial [Planctomycetes bacterium]|nr:hypothetical protein [Planctomycetota bacterium]